LRYFNVLEKQGDILLTYCQSKRKIVNQLVDINHRAPLIM
jgi:hypothetical protein